MFNATAARITLPKGFDAHVHFRDGELLKSVVPHTARVFDAAMVVPNVPAIWTGGEAHAYWERIRAATGNVGMRPWMSIKLTHRTTPEMIVSASSYPMIRAAKLYPQGATTGTRDGIVDVTSMAPVFAAMQQVGLVLCVHGERPVTPDDDDAYIMDAEEDYLPEIAWIVKHFPGLKVVLEHITTAKSVQFVENASVNVAATITAHHLVLTTNHVLAGGLRPHNFCYPVAKRPEDRMALLRAALHDTTGKFFFGSDSSPHLRGVKESACGCAGIYSAPVALPLLLELFIRAGSARFGYHSTVCINDEVCEYATTRLTRFVSESGCKFYDIPPSARTVTLEYNPWVVADELGGVVPFRAGKRMDWRIID